MIEVLKQALEALETPKPLDDYPPILNAYTKTINNAITAIKEAIREHAMYEVQRLGQEIEQEPVLTIEELEQEIYQNTRNFVSLDVMEWMLKRYYTHPPQRTWAGLTEQEQGAIMEDINAYGAKLYSFAKAIEAKLKQKNGFAEEKNND